MSTTLIKSASADLRRIFRGVVKQNEPMAKHTTYGVGGPADVFVEPADEADLATLLAWLHERSLPWLVIGGGANLLVSDAGIRGVVIRMGRPFSYIRFDGERVTTGAGARLGKVIDGAVRLGLSGLEYATGVPGTVGGAIIMNAGTYRGYIGDVVERVRVLRLDGTPEEMSHDDLQFAYRKSVLQDDHTRIVTEAGFHLRPGDKKELIRTVQFLKRRRTETQPNEGKSCGCVFKNPPGASAGKMIEQAGLKGKRIGDAVVADRHANFMLNMGSATATDIRRLAEEVRATVEKEFGVRLEYEARIVGDWTGFEEA